MVLDGRDNPGANNPVGDNPSGNNPAGDNLAGNDEQWRNRNRQEQRKRDERIAQQLQRQQEEDNAARTSSQSFSFNLTPSGSSVVRGTGTANSNPAEQSQGVRFVLNNDNGDNDDGWITIGSTTANMAEMSFNPQGTGNNQGSAINLNSHFNQEGADPHPDDLPVEGDPVGNPDVPQSTGNVETINVPAESGIRPGESARSAAARSAAARYAATRSAASRPAAGSSSVQSTFSLNDYFNQGADPHPDDLPVEGDPVRNPTVPQGTGNVESSESQVTQPINAVDNNNDGGTNRSHHRVLYHMRLNQETGEWVAGDTEGDIESNDGARPFQISSDNQGVQIRGVQITSRVVNSSGSDGNTFVIRTGSEGGNFENWSNLADHMAGLSQTQIESLPTRKLRSRIMEYDCAVCMEPMAADEEVRTLPCFHQLHVGCVDPWLHRKKMCPVCRAEVKIDYAEE